MSYNKKKTMRLGNAARFLLRFTAKKASHLKDTSHERKKCRFGWKWAAVIATGCPERRRVRAECRKKGFRFITRAHLAFSGRCWVPFSPHCPEKAERAPYRSLGKLVIMLFIPNQARAITGRLPTKPPPPRRSRRHL